jgi:hypothetical protein
MQAVQGSVAIVVIVIVSAIVKRCKAVPYLQPTVRIGGGRSASGFLAAQLLPTAAACITYMENLPS